MQYYAMIGAIGYHSVEADDDDQARDKIRVQLCHRGDGIYSRWCRFGMRVATFKRGIFTKERSKNGHHERVCSGDFGAN